MIPCKDCLVFAICKERLKDIDNSEFKSYSGIVLLDQICSLIHEYVQDQLLNDVKLYTIEKSFIDLYGYSFRPSLSYRMMLQMNITGVNHENTV
jgi:hypothetical protein